MRPIEFEGEVLVSDKFNDRKLIAHVRTYGCQQNVADGEKIKGILSTLGYTFSDDKDVADLILFNTCAVREHAEDRVFGNVGALKNLKRKNPDLIIVLCGCMMEQQHVVQKIKTSFPFVDITFGTNSLHKLPEFIKKVKSDRKKSFEYDTSNSEIVEGLPILRDVTTKKAFLSVMYGCDNFCSYCIVPYVRGRERSRKSSDIMLEFQDIIDSGYKDITLLGQNVNSYGKGLDEGIMFPKLLKNISDVKGDFWLRFMTSHPKDATKELFDTMASSEKICKHIHLPVQSGSNRVLKEMNRKYTREHYLEVVEYARKVMPDISITTDIIVGFPGETYEEFQETVSLVKKVGFTSLFTFIYSKREGTRAAKMDDPVSHEEKTKWFAELLEAQKEMSQKYCDMMVGKTEKVLVEKKSATEGLLSARTQGNVVVEVAGDESLVGDFVTVEIVGYKNWTLKGQIKNGRN